MAQIVLGTDSADESQATLFDSTEPMGDGLLSPAGDMMNTGQLVNSDSLRRADMLATVDRASTLYKHLKWQKNGG